VSYRIPDHVHARAVHDEIVILDARTDDYLGLNGSGSVAWSVLVGGGSAADAVAELTTRFEVPPETAEADVAALIGELLRRGLVALAGP
jgi:hypothetical protein